LRAKAKGGPIQSEKQIMDAISGMVKEDQSRVKMLEVEKNNSNVKPFKKQIRKFFEWYFEGNICKSRELRDIGEWTYHIFETK